MPHRTKYLSQFLLDHLDEATESNRQLQGLIIEISNAIKMIAHLVGRGKLANFQAETTVNVQGEEQKPLDVISNQIFVDALLNTGYISALASEEMDEILVANDENRGEFLLCFDPLDGSSNLDVNVAVGSIFSIHKSKNQSPIDLQQFVQKGAQQIAAGYGIYGPATMMVLSFGKGTFGFTLDNQTGEFILTHPEMKIAPNCNEFAINASNSRFWEPPIKRYVNECLMGKSGPRGKDFNMRWIASLVAEAHRILMRGGVFMYPRDNKDRSKAGRLRLLYEANPIGFLITQAGGKISDGYCDILEAKPSELHQRIALIFGSKNEILRIEDYHHNPEHKPLEIPLFGNRSLFRDTL